MRVVFVVAVAVSACSNAPATPRVVWRFDRSTLDPATDPCRDFYQYACGGFATIGHVPPDRGYASWEKDRAAVANDRAIHELLTGGDPAADPERSRLRTFYAACMASDRDRTADTTLHAWLARVDQIAIREDVPAVLRELHRAGIDALYSYDADDDPTDRGHYRAEVGDAGLARPRLYRDTGPDADARRDAYRAHIARTFELAGSAPREAARDADVVFDLDRTLAVAIPRRAQDGDPNQYEHPTTAQELATLAPHLAWPDYLAMVDHPTGARINVIAPSHLVAVDTAIAEQPIATLKAYVRWQLLRALGPALPGAQADEYYRFATLAGVQRPARGVECQVETLKALGVELSHQFATHYVGGRDAAQQIGDAVRAEIERSMATETWLSPAARAATTEKVRDLVLKIGFPEQWPETGSYALQSDTFLDNVIAARGFEQLRSWHRVRRERRRDSWENMVYPNEASGMAAARLTIPNGFPDLTANAIVFTAAMLQPPLFDADAPREVDYGAFGCIVGHELVHVIEEHHYDRHGELHETWTDADVGNHDARRACVIADADDFVAFDHTHLDGKQTYTENVADLSGVAFAYAAMARELGPRLTERGSDGLTRAQRFFIAYAQSYCEAERPSFVRENLRTDPHAPPRYRVNAPLESLPVFAQAFTCQPGTPMVRPASCSVW
jgi:endothelin-converting enzyme/putative endopeptidase